MKVRLTDALRLSIGGRSRWYLGGEVVDVSDSTAASLIAAGQAKSAELPPLREPKAKISRQQKAEYAGK
jgi:hypothetical protein